MNRPAGQADPGNNAVVDVAPTEDGQRTTPWYRTWKLIPAVSVVVLLLAASAIAVVVVSDRSDKTSAASSEQQAVADWWAHARDDFSLLQEAIDKTNRGLTRGDGTELKEGCQLMHDTAEVSIEAKMPTPDPELTAEVRSMIDDVHQASHMCLSAAAGSMNNYAGEFRSYLEQAQLQMQAAQDRATTLAGISPTSS